MPKEIIVEICMGSSCFARGNKTTALELKKIIQEKNLNSKVKIQGALCQGLCKEGPVVIINKKQYQHIDTASILDAVSEELKRAER